MALSKRVIKFKKDTRGSQGSIKSRVFIFFSVFILCLVIFAGLLYLVPKGRQMLFGQDYLRPAAVERGEIGGPVFADVPGDHPNALSLTYLKSKGIISGYGDGNFRPDNLITRAEVIKLVVSTLHVYPHNVRYSYCFGDVGNQWYAPYVCYAKEKGWVSGGGDNMFYPEQNVKGGEVLKILLNAYKIRGFEFPSEDTSEASAGSPWYESYVDFAETKGWLEPLDTETSFDPEMEMSRAHVAEILFRIIETDSPV